MYITTKCYLICVYIILISALKSGRRLPKCKVNPSPFNEDDVVVIIGGGAGGNTAAEKLREVYLDKFI